MNQSTAYLTKINPDLYLHEDRSIGRSLIIHSLKKTSGLAKKVREVLKDTNPTATILSTVKGL